MIMELTRDYPDARIIAISGGGNTTPGEFLPIAKDLGALSTFEKPFRGEDLLAEVQEILH